MRHVFISDVHSNIEALQSVLREIKTYFPLSRTYCCGDVVGYYADPSSCITILQSEDIPCVRGNHDLAVSGLHDLKCTWQVARNAIEWTRENIDEDQMDYLVGLPRTITNTRYSGDDRPKFIMFHGALHNVEWPEDLHLTKQEDILLSFKALIELPKKPRIGFFGHTHRPVVHRYTKGVVETINNPDKVELDNSSYYLINPGSVGQARDTTAKNVASFLVFNDEKGVVTFYTTKYDFSSTWEKAKAAGLLEKPLFQRYAMRIFNKLRKVL